MLLWGANMDGEYTTSMQYAAKMRQFPALFGPTYMSDAREKVAMRLTQAMFGRWEPLLQLQPSDFDYSTTGDDMLEFAAHHSARQRTYTSRWATAYMQTMLQQLHHFATTCCAIRQTCNAHHLQCEYPLPCDILT